MNKHMSGIAAIIATIIFSFISSFRKRSPPRGITKKLSYINKQIDFYENLFKISQDTMRNVRIFHNIKLDWEK